MINFQFHMTTKMVTTRGFRVFLLLIYVNLFNRVELSDVKTAYVTVDQQQNFKIQENEVSVWVAKAEFTNAVNETGWSYLSVETSPLYTDKMQAYAAGLAEGFLTQDFISMHWINTVEGYCEMPYSKYCKRLYTFLLENIKWMNQKIDDSVGQDPYWHMVDLFLSQVSGLTDGYKDNPGNISTNVDPFGLYFFQIGGDLEDLEPVLGKQDLSRHPIGSGSCSALVKLLPGNKDLYVAHDTWSSYQSMLRILKRYNFPFQTSVSSKVTVPGRIMTLSSYPGTLMSGDDYYLISSGMVSMETTIGNDNADRWQYVKPLDSVMEGIRTMVANRLAMSGEQWSENFEQFNSGTYNNQWMVVDYKKFDQGNSNMDGLLTILEQIPGMIKYEDMTWLLLNQSYWPSYNIPYFPVIFNASGQPENVKKYGDWFTYDMSPRGRIFRRDNGKVTDLNSMIKLMRYNNYKYDPYSHCNCTPPYSAENAISARCDLNPANGTYPFEALGHRSHGGTDMKHDPISACNCTPPYSGENGISARSDLNPASGTYPFGALGHRPHGGTDMKLTNFQLFKELQFVAVAGPTYDDLPPFQWSKADFADACPHHGHPDIFKFEPIMFDGI